MIRFAPLPDRTCLRLSGDDWRPFLHNLISGNVLDLAPGALGYGLLLTPQGRFLFDLFVLPLADGSALIDADAARRDELARRLALYRLRAKVAIEPSDARVLAAWGTDASETPPGDGWVRDPRLPALGWRAYGAAAPAGAEAGDYDAMRLDLGVCDPARDCAPDRTYPIEACLDLLNAIDFKKGCFVGQETTSRMKRRGTVKTRLAPLDFDGPPPAPGAEVLAGALRAGEVASGRTGRALAYLRLDRAGGALTVEGRPVRPRLPSWWPPQIRFGPAELD